MGSGGKKANAGTGKRVLSNRHAHARQHNEYLTLNARTPKQKDLFCTSWSHNNSQCSSHSVCPGPFLRCLNRSRLIFLPPFGDIIGKRVIGIWGTKQGLDRQKDRADLKSWRPVV